MTGNGEEPVDVDWGLAVLSRDNDGRLIEKAFTLQSLYHLTDRHIHKFDLVEHAGCGVPGGIQIAARRLTRLDQFLTHTNRLEIHSKDNRYRSLAGAQVRLAIDPVQNGVYFELVIAADLNEAGGPVAARGVDN